MMRYTSLTIIIMSITNTAELMLNHSRIAKSYYNMLRIDLFVKLGI
jgi:hypothetical protein